MKKTHFVNIFAVFVLVISAFTVVSVKLRDTEPPEISYGEEIIHLAGTDLTQLLAGVKAWDDRDGDVTASLTLSRLYPVSDDTGVVVYVAKDAANNIVTKRRSFTYEEAARESIFAPNSILEMMTQLKGNDSESNGNGSGTDGSGVENSGSGAETGANGTGTNENDTEPTGNASGSNGNGSGQNGSSQTGGNGDNQNGSLTDAEYAKLKAENQEKGYPYVRLKVHEVTLHVGDRFSIYTYISEVGDDVDTINTMLRLEHNVDTSIPGVYQAEVYARDSDGHVSNKEWLKVTVEGE